MWLSLLLGNNTLTRELAERLRLLGFRLVGEAAHFVANLQLERPTLHNFNFFCKRLFALTGDDSARTLSSFLNQLAMTG
jgi:hypothetical protein